jgi:hypothetical protein
MVESTPRSFNTHLTTTNSSCDSQKIFAVQRQALKDGETLS